MEFGDIIGFVFLGIVALFILYFVLTSICSTLAEPHNAKKQAIEREEKNQIEELKKKQEELDKLIKNNDIVVKKAIEAEQKRYAELLQELATKEKRLKEDAEKHLQKRERELKSEVWNRFLARTFETIEKEYNLEGLYSSVEAGRWANAYESELLLTNLSVSSVVVSNENEYNTTLKSCTCTDFQTRHMPCKHMLHLACSLGVLLLNNERAKKSESNLEETIISLSKEKQNLQNGVNRLNKKQENAEKVLRETEALIRERAERYPIIAGVISDLYGIYYDKIAKHLDSKSRPAHGAAETVRNLKREGQALAKAKKELEFKLAYIQELFPNINDIFESGFNDEKFELETDETTDRVRLYLSDEEYRELSVTERNQRALDNYVANRKSKWQVGRDYEMYIGYLCEQKGYKVEYTGIIQKLEDMGRDLIATKDNEVLVIQCKNWAQEKTIHEKHIFQLYGTVIMYSLNSMLRVRGVFITTTKLSPTAKQVAEYLGIIVMEQEPLGEFPRIKCNINRADGEKIYHLPFDQQYDKTVIDAGNGECYALTVAEAESKGYRRAFKHHAC